MAKNYRNIVVKTHSPLKSAFFAIVHSPPISLLSNGRFAESLFFALFGYVLAVVGEDKGEPAARTTNHTRLELSFNESGTWAPVSGAHFQGDDCKARLLSAFSEEISKRA
jgi:hypothetical protein